MQNYAEKYAAFLKGHLDLKRPVKVIADSSNGSTGIVLKELMNVPNLTLKVINDTPDGDFPAHGPNPLEHGATAELSKMVVAEKADFGVAFDADGDRAFIIDNDGKLLAGFQTSLLLFKNNKPPYVSDELVYQSLKHLNLYSDDELKPSRVGSRFLKDAMKEFKASAGGEFSSHYYFDKFFGLDSGIFTMVEIANVVSAMEGTLSSFLATIPPHELVNENIKVEGKDVKEILNKIEASYKDKASIGHRDGITIDLGQTWISIRSSNTEPILRLIAGAPTEAESQALINDIKTFI